MASFTCSNVAGRQRTTLERFDGATGYPPSLVEGAPLSTIVPQEGDLYIFHPEIFHDIAPMFGPRNRITQGIFFAMSDTDKRVVTWG